MFVHPQNLEAGESFGWRHGFKVCTGSLYLGGYITDDVSKGDWLKNSTEKWERDICAISKMGDIYHQDSYYAVACAVQSYWIFMKRVTKDTRQVFMGL